MKKGILFFLMISLVLVCAGCGSAPARTDASPAPTATAESAPEAAPESVQEPENAQTPESAPQTEPAEEPAESEAQNTTLVVYFSGTGTTRGVAERIAAVTGADLVEIVPAQPYSAEDLNYNDPTTCATVEQNTPDARPEITNEISLEGYTTVYLGYPIWWGQAPRILSTFVESHDFTGITVVPFCTSGSSGAGRTGEKLGEQAGTGTFLASTRFDGAVSEAQLQAWIDRQA